MFARAFAVILGAIALSRLPFSYIWNIRTPAPCAAGVSMHSPRDIRRIRRVV